MFNTSPNQIDSKSNDYWTETIYRLSHNTLSHSRSFEMTPLSRVRVGPY